MRVQSGYGCKGIWLQRSLANQAQAVQQQHEQLSTHWVGRAAPFHNSPCNCSFLRLRLPCLRAFLLFGCFAGSLWQTRPQISDSSATGIFLGLPNPFPHGRLEQIICWWHQYANNYCDACRIIFHKNDRNDIFVFYLYSARILRSAKPSDKWFDDFWHKYFEIQTGRARLVRLPVSPA